MSATLRLAEQLISRQSVTPDDAHCQAIIRARLEPLGFICEDMPSGPPEHRVSNLWAVRRSAEPQAKLLVLAGHTDVVPSGAPERWQSSPFVPTHRDGKLYGRGASDMKTSIAAMVVAVEEYLAAQPQTPLSLAFLLTSDEEGPAHDGTVVVCEALRQRGERPDYCVLGEPTATRQTGDTIKNGRRGTLSGKLTVQGVQGHVAYPHLAQNPIHLLAPALAELVNTPWDQGNADFPATTWQVSNIHAGTGVGNVIPGSVVIDFNFRFSTASTPEQLQQRVAVLLARHGLNYELVWTLGGQAFLTPVGSLVDAVRRAIHAETGLHAALSTDGGTSDGRFLAQVCAQVIEVGPPNASVHKVDEHVVLADIEPLKNIYRRVLDELARAN